jgi:hypothetical protein
MPRRYGRPGLVGTMARTAVIAGTATAVSGSVADRRQAPAQPAPPPAAPVQATPAPPPEPTTPASQDATMAELERLAEMKQEGLLTDEEFAVMKARLLGLAP